MVMVVVVMNKVNTDKHDSGDGGGDDTLHKHWQTWLWWWWWWLVAAVVVAVAMLSNNDNNSYSFLNIYASQLLGIHYLN